ncbi:hypothetical protein [Methanobrevibacter millerae]|uniref:hypothetical protein n=1 Tax=Methanobrevibacter millerae TaxID=230361 RepID=UPI000A753EF6|nr:hypothetical protein [Methanobrevibacter millerae]
MNDFKDKCHISDEKYEEYYRQLKMIKYLFDLENYEDSNKEFQSLIYREKEFHPIIYKIIRKSSSSRYKNFIFHLNIIK